jgi:hypothetical protein
VRDKNAISSGAALAVSVALDVRVAVGLGTSGSTVAGSGGIEGSKSDEFEGIAESPFEWAPPVGGVDWLQRGVGS